MVGIPIITDQTSWLYEQPYPVKHQRREHVTQKPISGFWGVLAPLQTSGQAGAQRG